MRNSLVQRDRRFDLIPKSGVFDACHFFLWVTVDMNVNHQTAEGSAQLSRKVLTLGTPNRLKVE